MIGVIVVLIWFCTIVAWCFYALFEKRCGHRIWSLALSLAVGKLLAAGILYYDATNKP